MLTVSTPSYTPLFCAFADLAFMDILDEHHMQSGTTTEDRPPTDELAETPLTEMCLQWYSVPADMAASGRISPYQRALRREMEILFGVPNHDTVNGLIPAAVCSTIPLIVYMTSRWFSSQNYAMPSPLQVAEGHPLTTTTETNHSCSTTGFCQWPGAGDSVACGAQLSCKTVPAHFRNIHNIRRINEEELVSCQWPGCHKTLMRKSFVRHIRECHLNHPRIMKHRS